MSLRTLFHLSVLPWLANAQLRRDNPGGCATPKVHYVTRAEPPCCTAAVSSNFAELVNRSVHDASADSLMSELVYPGLQHFGISSVSSRPRFERPQKIFGKLYVRRLFDVSQKSQEFTMLLDIYWCWRDCRLVYNGSSTGGPLVVNDRSPLFEDLFIPEVAFKEEAHSTETRNLDQSVLIFGDGMVTQRQHFSRRLSCSFHFEELPFDVHNCAMTVSMPEFTSDMVELIWEPDPLEMETLASGEWVISGYDEWKKSLATTSYDAKDPGKKRSISALTWSFSLTRKCYDLIFEFIVPSAVYWLCSYGGLWVDASAVPGRVALGLIPILTLNNKMGQLRGSLPPVNRSSRLENFMVSSFLLTILQLMEFCVLNFAIHYVKAAKAQKEDCQVELASSPHPDPEAGGRKRRTRLASPLYLPFATWVQQNLDHFSRYLFFGLFSVLLLTTLWPWWDA